MGSVGLGEQFMHRSFPALLPRARLAVIRVISQQILFSVKRCIRVMVGGKVRSDGFDLISVDCGVMLETGVCVFIWKHCLIVFKIL